MKNETEGVVELLRLNLKGCYFDAIRDGTKTHEYRLAAKWEKRLAGKTYDEILLLRGYPKRGANRSKNAGNAAF